MSLEKCLKQCNHHTNQNNFHHHNVSVAINSPTFQLQAYNYMINITYRLILSIPELCIHGITVFLFVSGLVSFTHIIFQKFNYVVTYINFFFH